MSEILYPRERIENALRSLDFVEIITDDKNVIFYQNFDRGLVTIQKDWNELDEILVRVICQNIGMNFDEFVRIVNQS